MMNEYKYRPDEIAAKIIMASLPNENGQGIQNPVELLKQELKFTASNIELLKHKANTGTNQEYVDRARRTIASLEEKAQELQWKIDYIRGV